MFSLAQRLVTQAGERPRPDHLSPVAGLWYFAATVARLVFLRGALATAFLATGFLLLTCRSRSLMVMLYFFNTASIFLRAS